MRHEDFFYVSCTGERTALDKAPLPRSKYFKHCHWFRENMSYWLQSKGAILVLLTTLIVMTDKSFGIKMIVESVLSKVSHSSCGFLTFIVCRKQ